MPNAVLTIRHPRRRVRLSARSVLCHAALAFTVVVIAAPFAWMMSTSLKALPDVYRFPPQWIPSPIQWDNYPAAWRAAPFGRFFFNSVVVTFSIVAIQLVTSSLAAYVFARLRFPGRDTIFLMFLATLMVPVQVTVVPVFVILKVFGWLDAYPSLIVPFAASAFGTFLLRQSFLAIPQELTDAARIDGASHLQTLMHVMLPLARPALVTFALLSFTWRWNDYFWPLIVTNSVHMRTVPVGLVLMRASEGGVQWHLVMAATVMAIAPVMLVFLVAQRQFVQGVATSGLKG